MRQVVLEDVAFMTQVLIGRNRFMGTSCLICSALKAKVAEMTLNFLSFDLNFFVVFFQNLY